MRIIAYTYEADFHCVDCTLSRFGTYANLDQCEDSEGNSIHPVFSTDEVYEPVCGDCLEEID